MQNARWAHALEALSAQIFKYALYISVPLVFGYGLGRLPEFWERAAEVVGGAQRSVVGA